MLRYLLILSFLSLELFSCYGEFSSCQNKANDSKTFIANDTLSISIKHNERLVYSTSKPTAKIKKYDPFLGLYLIDDNKHFPYPFIFHTDKSKKLASISKTHYKQGSITKQCGLDKLGTFSKNIKSLAIITNNCCALAGILTPKGVIDQLYLKHFLKFKNKKMLYGDAGIRLIQSKKSLHVSVVDPFFKNQLFMLNDEILAFDNKKISSLCKLRRQILFSKIGSVHIFKIKRHGKIKYLKVKISKRLGGGLLSDTFLEHFDINLNKNFCINSISSKSADMGLKVGDCLIQVNNKDIKSKKDIQLSVQKSDIGNALLFERKGFQFFIHINGKNGRITKKNN